MKQTQSACPNIKCKRHCKREECHVNYRNKNMYCQLRERSFRKRFINRLFRAGKAGAI